MVNLWFWFIIMGACSGYSKSYYFSPKISKSALGRPMDCRPRHFSNFEVQFRFWSMPVLAIANPITFPRGVQNQIWGAQWTAAPRHFSNFERTKSDFGLTIMDACSGYSKSYHFSPKISKSALGRPMDCRPRHF